MILTKVRLAIAALALAGAGLWLWNIHDALAERRVRTAMDRFHEKQRLMDEKRLRAARRHHREVTALKARNRKLKARINVEDDPRCAWGADTVRLLNAARGHGPVPAGQPDGALPSTARVARAGPPQRAD